MSRPVLTAPSIDRMKKMPNAHRLPVRVPGKRGGTFDPTGTDPFGAGEDGGIVFSGPASGPAWYVRRFNNRVALRWYVEDDSQSVDNSAALQKAITLASSQALPIDLEGKTYGLAPETKIESAVRIENGAFVVAEQSGDYAFFIRVESSATGAEMRRLTIDTSGASTHAGNGRSLVIQGDDTKLVDCTVTGERDLGAKELSHGIFTTGANDVSLVRVTVEDAAGTAFRVKECDRLRVVDCNAVNWEFKGFGYDSDAGGAGSIFVEGTFHSRSDTTETGSDGFLIDPGSGNNLGLLVADTLDLQSGQSNSAKLEYIDECRIGTIIAMSPDATNAVKWDNVLSMQITKIVCNKGIKIEPPDGNDKTLDGPSSVEQIISDVDGDDWNISHSGADMLHVTQARLAGAAVRGVRMGFGGTGVEQRHTHIKECTFDPDVNTASLFESNNEYRPEIFSVERVEWLGGTDRTNLAPSNADRTSIPRALRSAGRIFEGDSDPGTVLPDNDGFQAGDRVIHRDAGSGDVSYWQFDGSTWQDGPTL